MTGSKGSSGYASRTRDRIDGNDMTGSGCKGMVVGCVISPFRRNYPRKPRWRSVEIDVILKIRIIVGSWY